MKQMIVAMASCLAISASYGQRVYQAVETANGSKEVISVMVPDGWRQDNQHKHGIYAKNVLVKADEVGEPGSGKIYIQTIPMESDQLSVEELIAREKMMYKTAQTEVKEKTKLITEEDKTEVSVIKVKGSVDDAHQLVAFIPLTTSVAVVTLSTPYEQFVNDHWADFESLIKSFQLNPHLRPARPIDVISQIGE